MKILTAIVLLFLINKPVQADEPLNQVKKVVSSVDEILKDKKLAGVARDERLRKVLDDFFDWRALAESSLESDFKLYLDHQGYLDKSAVDYFFRICRDAIVQSKISNVQYLKERVRENLATVFTTAVLQDIQQVHVNYYLHRTTLGWRVYEVGISGESLVKSFRQRFSEALKKRGRS